MFRKSSERQKIKVTFYLSLYDTFMNHYVLLIIFSKYIFLLGKDIKCLDFKIPGSMDAQYDQLLPIP